MNSEKLIGAKEACAIIGRGFYPSKLYYYVKRGTAPKNQFIGGVYLFDLDSVKKWKKPKPVKTGRPRKK